MKTIDFEATTGTGKETQSKVRTRSPNRRKAGGTFVHESKVHAKEEEEPWTVSSFANGNLKHSSKKSQVKKMHFSNHDTQVVDFLQCANPTRNVTLKCKNTHQRLPISPDFKEFFCEVWTEREELARHTARKLHTSLISGAHEDVQHTNFSRLLSNK